MAISGRRRGIGLDFAESDVATGATDIRVGALPVVDVDVCATFATDDTELDGTTDGTNREEPVVVLGGVVVIVVVVVVGGAEEDIVVTGSFAVEVTGKAMIVIGTMEEVATGVVVVMALVVVVTVELVFVVVGNDVDVDTIVVVVHRLTLSLALFSHGLRLALFAAPNSTRTETTKTALTLLMQCG